MPAAGVSPHDMMPLPAHDERAREDFCRTLAVKLAAEVRPRLARLYKDEVEPAFKMREGRAPDHQDIANEMRSRLPAQYWYRLRTDNQDRMYAASGAIISRQLETLAQKAEALSGTLGSLTLDPDLEMPRYLTELDIHRKPGGYHSEYVPGDVAAGAEYDRTISVHNMGSQGLYNDDPGRSLATWIKQHYPDLKPKRILDLGCTIGNNTLPYGTVFPDAELHGVDVSAPCLRYAHARACAMGVEAHFHQMNAEAMSFDDQSFDLIVSRILLHETSNAAWPNIVAECFRLLKPGGVMLHCDAPQFDSLTPYQASLRDWDATCNNEPFMLTAYTLPLEDIYAAAGFDKAKTFRSTAPSLYFADHALDPNATPGFSGDYFFTGAQK